MKYEISNGKIKAIVDSYGAQLCSVQTMDGTEYLWQGDVNTWEDHAPNLFPYVARLWDGKYTYGGQEYSMQIHGIAMYTEFACEKVAENKLVCFFEDTEETRKQYPFAFRFTTIYELVDQKVQITYQVDNKTERTMYFGLGGHPGFNVPLYEDETFEEYYLQFPLDAKIEKVGITNTGYLQGEATAFELEKQQLPLRHNLFDEDAIVLQKMGNEIDLVGPKGRVLTVRYPGMDYLGLWHWPKTEVPYVCIEPWCTLPSRLGVIEAFEEKKDMIQVEAHQTYTNVWEIELA